MLDARTTESPPSTATPVDYVPSPVAWLEQLRDAALVYVPADAPDATQHLRTAVHHLRAWLAPARDAALEGELRHLLRRPRHASCATGMVDALVRTYRERVTPTPAND